MNLTPVHTQLSKGIYFSYEYTSPYMEYNVYTTVLGNCYVDPCVIIDIRIRTIVKNEIKNS